MTAFPWEATAALGAAAVTVLALPRAARTLRKAAGPAKPLRGIIAFLLLLGLGISGATFISVYRTVTAVMDPYMGWWSWTVPVSGEIAFMFAFGCGVVLAARKVAGGEFLRGSVMAVLVAGSVVLNVWAARGVVPDVVGHLEVVGSFFGVALIGKSTIMALGGGKLRADRITAGEWIAHPVHSARLWRWMMTWGEPSRKAAHERYMLLLLAITVAQDTAGQDGKRIGSRPFCWRRKLPTLLRYQLATGSLPAPPPYGDPQESISGHVASQLAHLDARRSQVTPQGGTQVSEQVTSQAVSQVAGQGEGKPQGQGEARSRTDAELKPEIRRSARSFRKSNPGNDRGVITHVAGDLGIGRDRARRLLAELDASSLPSIEDRREARNAAVR